jgi:hypothetical protein
MVTTTGRPAGAPSVAGCWLVFVCGSERIRFSRSDSPGVVSQTASFPMPPWPLRVPGGFLKEMYAGGETEFWRRRGSGGFARGQRRGANHAHGVTDIGTATPGSSLIQSSRIRLPNPSHGFQQRPTVTTTGRPVIPPDRSAGLEEGDHRQNAPADHDHEPRSCWPASADRPF